MKPRKAGIREAKAQLSRLVAEAAQGAEWTITDRGRPVARLGPVPAAERSPDRLQPLVDLGWVEPLPPGRRRSRRLPRPIQLPGVDAQAMLQEDRNG